MFFYKVEGHMPKLSSFGRGKKFRPKKSLTSLLHAALQLCLVVIIFFAIVNTRQVEHIRIFSFKLFVEAEYNFRTWG